MNLFGLLAITHAIAGDAFGGVAGLMAESAYSRTRKPNAGKWRRKRKQALDWDSNVRRRKRWEELRRRRNAK